MLSDQDMNKNDFDRLFKEKFDEHDFAYNPLNWDKLSRELPKEKNNRRLLPWLTGVAASIALLAGGYWFFNNAPDTKTDVVVNQPKDETQQNVELPQPAQESIIDKKENSEEQNPLQKIVPSSSNAIVNRTKSSNNVISAQPINTNTKKTENINSPIFEPYEKNLIPTPIAETKPHEEIVTNSNTMPVPTKSITKDPIFFPSDDNFNTPRERNTAVSLAGGFNYGSLNAGYMASVNARQKIGSKLFIEGDLGFMQNQEVVAASMSTNQFNTITSGSTMGRPAKIEEKPNSIYYLQMSPSIGYQLHKNISVGVGADVQKLLDGNNEDRPVITTNDGFKLIPLWDAGVIGKTEYSISKRLKAGILYREGVNNLIKGNNNYYERRYLQIQMKLKLFGK